MLGKHKRVKKLLEKAPRIHEGYRLHYIPSLPDPRDYKYYDLIGVRKAAYRPLPIDYRPKLPPVFDQGNRGTCVACAADWTLKAYQEIMQNDFPANGLSAAFLYTLCKQVDENPDVEGTTPKAAMQVLRSYGICLEDTMPYSTIADLPAPQIPAVTNDALAEAGNYKISTYAQICSMQDINRSNTITVMREALKREGPFIMALLVCENFKPNINGVLPLPAGRILGGHAVGIAGDLPDKNCFILRNSWGKSWGRNGYAYLPYEWVTGKKFCTGWYTFEAWTATDLPVNGTGGK